MKKLFLAVLCVLVCVALVVPVSAAGKITVNQSQNQGVIQSQSSIGGLSSSTQAYATGAKAEYVITKSPTFLSPSSGVATASTSTKTVGNQVKFGNGIQTQKMLGVTTNNGGLHW
jgi:hypothetical protein